ncbi:hypothetical protein COCON_G00230930 [Conger conger]|uniref:Uncharacterized protein n=1 Tax=Conger conger TaxID=82655 RepID=A0A9Q1CVX1_CONCO|nr:hypothetical protein COCON_G00230930 [Conger conger]
MCPEGPCLVTEVHTPSRIDATALTKSIAATWQQHRVSVPTLAKLGGETAKPRPRLNAEIKAGDQEPLKDKIIWCA